MKRKIIILLLVITLLFPIGIKAEELNITKNAKSTILIETTSGEVLYEKNMNDKRAVASLTKMMSLIIFFETIEKDGLTLDEKITVSKNAKEMGGTQIYLETGEKISVSDLLKGITMASANDATVALAERVAGTEENFVVIMNKKVKELGLQNTQFKNCTGLDEDGHFSTAYDMAMIAKELLTHKQILEFTSVYEDYIRKDTDNKTWVVNTNKLVRFYTGADGLKTGFTDDAGSCMAVTAKRNGLRLLTINLGYEDVNQRNEETAAILDYGFNIWKADVLKEEGEVIGKYKLDKANVEEVDLVLLEDASILLKKTESNKKYDYETKIDNIKYPLKKGDVVGSLIIKENNKIIKEVRLTINQDIYKVNLFKLFLRNFKDTILGSFS